MKTIILVLLMSFPAFGNNVYKERCAGCHGQKGEGIAGYSPRLAGQHWQYLRDQIRDIKLERRTNGMSFVMTPLFKELTKEEIEVLSKYLEKK